MPIPTVSPEAVAAARQQLDAHLLEILRWHFSPETGSPFWLDWAAKNWDPRKEIQSFADVQKFPHFQDEFLRDLQPEAWVPAAFKGKPFNIFETGGTTGMPKQRIGWNDYKVDYSEFSDKIADEHFPRGGAWLMMGPTGPRRLRLAIEHLANVRGSSCYFIDLDPRFVKKVISNRQFEVAKQYMAHVVDQAVTILKHRKVSGLFTTPKLLEALAEKTNLWEAGIRGVFCGGTSMKPQEVRFIVEELLEGRIGFYPTYGNTLMGLAASVPLQPEDNFSVTYYAPQPRAVLRVVKPGRDHRAVTGFVVVLTVGFGVAHLYLHRSLGGTDAGPLPSTAEIVAHFHGRPAETRLKQMISGKMKRFFSAEEDPDKLDADEQKQWQAVLDWTTHGGPEAAYWNPQSHEPGPILKLLKENACTECHNPHATRKGNKRESPLDTYAAISKFNQPGGGMDVDRLLMLSHVHLLGMALMFLGITIPLGMTTWPAQLRSAFSAAGFASILLDIGGWWGVKYAGEPLVPLVLLGGVLMGVSFAAAALAVLADLWLPGRALDSKP